MNRHEQFRSDPKLYEDYYGQQAGYGLPVFVGSRNYRGGGLGNILSGLGRSLMPLVKKGGRALLKEGLNTGLGVIQDVVSGKNVKSALESRSKAAGKRLWQGVVNEIRPNKRIKAAETRKSIQSASRTPTLNRKRSKGKNKKRTVQRDILS